MSQTKHNFGAGPCILPPVVLEGSAEAVRELDGSGLSLLEISHRSPAFSAVIFETEKLVRELLQVPDTYSVLFLQGGASMQFAMIPMNFLGSEQTAYYLDGGYFGKKAISEAKVTGQVKVVDKADALIPKEAAYFHITSNNTIEGTQLPVFPVTLAPLVCDMSSDIFSRPVDITQFDLVYAGAQKNMGPAGMTLVIARNSFLDSIRNKVHAILDYRVYREHGSMYNTPPVFAIYAAMLNLRWLKSRGGVKFTQLENRAKAQLLYDEIDRNPLFYGLAKKEERSVMNVTFKMHDAGKEKDFLAFCEQRGIVGIAGYRTVGGFRASLYNALPYESVQALVKGMQDYGNN
ncbi:3-phosphoserine/phosphohydroxythreonine transaminase [Mucilaginibacter corticis]|uniref:Phosphoserine aminotransferase n=1 Tax=Mucilaginibacter corticis TaxID=2597670 RepID=A0A556M9K3_9SPHI|nr:3-phosphoserine/phosphohydroxythreonine transaminase [Mucilaginibacter corticis]TSJ36594.1 3-phosphoserine/phosphohydroxythreonine transaminase [Mucilaginibacter corticis]